jgi:hypothetical protein
MNEKHELRYSLFEQAHSLVEKIQSAPDDIPVYCPQGEVVTIISTTIFSQ